MPEIAICNAVTDYAQERFVRAGQNLGLPLAFYYIDERHDQRAAARIPFPVRRISRWEDLPSGVLAIPGHENAVIGCALHQGGMQGEIAKAFSDKFSMRQRFERFLVPQPHYWLAREDESWKNLDGPWIVKPRQRSGSEGVRLCYSIEEVIDTSNHLSTRMGEDDGFEPMVEEYVSGDEFSIEVVIQGGNQIFVCVTKKAVTELPICHELGHYVNWRLDEDAHETLHDLIGCLIKAWALQDDVLHIEVKSDPKKFSPRLIEAGKRIGGGYISVAIDMLTGFSMEQAFLEGRCLRKCMATPIATQNISDDAIAIRFAFRGISYGLPPIPSNCRVVGDWPIDYQFWHTRSQGVDGQHERERATAVRGKSGSDMYDALFAHARKGS